MRAAGARAVGARAGARDATASAARASASAARVAARMGWRMAGVGRGTCTRGASVEPSGEHCHAAPGVGVVREAARARRR